MAPSKSSSSTTTKESKAKASRVSRPVKPSLSTKFVQDSSESDEKVNGVPQKKDRNPINPKSSGVSSRVPVRPTTTADSDERPSKKRKISSSSPAESLETHDRATATDESGPDAEDDSTKDSSSAVSSPTPARRNSISDHSSHDPPNKALRTSSSKAKPQQSSSKAKALSTVHQIDKETSEDDTSKTSENESSGSSKSESKDEEVSSSNDSSRSGTGRDEPSPQLVRSYEPPPGFEPAIVSIHPSTKIMEILTPSNLKGRQIWHITAPASVPLASVKEVAIQDIRDGASIISHKGAEYGFAPEIIVGQVTNNTLILPSTHSNAYELSKTTITKTLHLQQLVSLPSRAVAPLNAPNSTAARPQTHVKVPRQQPPGLRMRYHPFGVAEDSESDTSQTTEPMFRAPQPLDTGSPEQQRSHSSKDKDDHSARTFPAQKGKEKPLRDKRIETNSAAMDIDARADEESMKKTSQSKKLQPEKDANTFDNSIRNEPRKRKKEGKRQGQDGVSPAIQSLLPADLTKEAETIVPEEVVNQDIDINIVHIDKDSKEEKARRKEARRKRKESELTKHQPNGQNEEPSTGLSLPTDASSQKPVSQISLTKHQTSSQDTQRNEIKETKEETKRGEKEAKSCSQF